MKMINVLAVSILMSGSAFAAEPQIKVAAVEAAKVAPSKPAVKAAAVKTSEVVVHDYRLEREGCCYSQN